MEKELHYGIILIAFLSIIVLGLIISLAFDEYIDKKRKSIIYVTLFLILTLITQNCLEFYLINFHSAPKLRIALAVLGYVIRPIIIVLYLYILRPNIKHIVAWILVGINLIIHLTAFFSTICFTITSDNNYFGGPLKYTCLIISSVLLAYFLYLTLIEFKTIKKREALIPFFLFIIIVLAVIFDLFYNNKGQMIDYVTIAIASVTVFYYIWLHLKFVREHEKGLIMEQQIQLMLSQIQPHFIYNSLSSISELCDINPKEAQKLTNNFAEYLRYNFSALTSEKLVSFEKQLEQVKFYLNIEKVRFQDRLNIQFDIKSSSFYLPNLTIQPLVENAVKHGICKTEKGGTITIRSYENETHYVVEIIDNGVGFDVNNIVQDGKTHLGIQNVRARLINCNDKFIIESQKGKGTKVTIIAPKNNIGGSNNKCKK